MKTTDIYTLIEEYRNGRDIWSRTAVELSVREIVRLRKRIEELEAERRWIPVSERNPHSNGLYDVWITGVHNSISAIYRNGKWNMFGVTHWRCKPQPPSEGE